MMDSKRAVAVIWCVLQGGDAALYARQNMSFRESVVTEGVNNATDSLLHEAMFSGAIVLCCIAALFYVPALWGVVVLKFLELLGALSYGFFINFDNLFSSSSVIIMTIAVLHLLRPIPFVTSLGKLFVRPMK